MDRAKGALLGLAVGDALGTTLEFSRRDEGPLHTEIVGKGPFGLKPGQWTDDTSMALALAASLIERGGFEARDVMDRFVAWWRQGEYSCTGECFDIGQTIKGALSLYVRDGRPFAGSTSPDTAGNGSIMRLAPAVLHGLRSVDVVLDTAVGQGRTTHQAPECIEACMLMATILRDAILRGPGAPVRYEVETWSGTEPAIAAIAKGGWRGRNRSEIRSTGHVAGTLEAALWAVERTASFEDAVVLAVNLAGDADTVGAVAGQIAGAVYGAAGIPDRWKSILAWRHEIERDAVALVAGAPARRQGMIGRLLRGRSV